MSDCSCCRGDCPTCNDVPESCCAHYIPTEPWVCVRPAPKNRTNCPTGNWYGCDEMFELCKPEPGTLDADQVAAMEALLVSAMVYFPSYSTLNFGSCGCFSKVAYGRDSNCVASWMGGVATFKTACQPEAPQEKMCGCGCGKGTALLKFWTPTIPDQCCQKIVVDENGEVVLDDAGNPVTEPQQLLFGAVPPTHPHWTRYGGTPSAGVDFDHIHPATSAKIVGLFCALICAVQEAGSSAG